MEKLVRTAVAAALILPLLTVGDAVAVHHCSVTNARTAVAYGGLQAAVDAARDGDKLVVRRRCVGNTVIDGKSLLVLGMRIGSFAKATLDGGGNGSVIRVESGALELRSVWVTNGGAQRGAGIWAGDGSQLVLSGSTYVTGNITQMGGEGGGLFARGAEVTLNDGASIGGNQAWYGQGGGIYANSSVIELNDDSSVTRNRARNGGIFALRSSVTLNGFASVSRNISRMWAAGGIHAPNGSVTLNDYASVFANIGRVEGGIGARHVLMNGSSSVHRNVGSGITVSGPHGDATLNDTATVRGNRSASGGGLEAAWTSTISLNGNATITGNVASWAGGGIYGGAHVVLRDASSVIGNVAEYAGGIAYTGRVELWGSASVIDNTATGGSGGGIAANVTDPLPVFVCSAGALISPNSPDDPPPTAPCT